MPPELPPTDLPAFDLVERVRPVALVAETTATPLGAGTHRFPRPAPSLALSAPVDGVTELELQVAGHRWVARVDPAARTTGVELHSPDAAGARWVRSRRHGRISRSQGVSDLGFTLTGRHLAVLTRSNGAWTVRARVDLREAAPGLDLHDTTTLQGLVVRGPQGLVAGGFGQLGLRDIRWVTESDGTPVRDGDLLLFSATHAGPGFFDTGHTGLWSFDATTHALAHRSDLFFHRDGHRGPGAYGDHATHVVRHRGGWLVATSTWSDFDLDDPHIRAVVARTDRDVTRGEHLLDAEDLDLPADGLASRGVWDPYLVHDGARWLVAYVSAQRFFSFHPALAAGPNLGELSLLRADTTRTACEGVTLAHLGDPGHGWSLLASDGPDSVRGRRQQYPVFDLAVRQVGTLTAPHPSNIPWPNLVRQGRDWLLVTFDGTPAGGRLVDYGTHGDVLVMRGRGTESAAPQVTDR